MRSYQEKIIEAITNRTNWMGQNTSVVTNGNVTTISYYYTNIGVVNHSKKTAKLNNGGYNTMSTNSRINAIKQFCEDNGYSY